MLALVSLFLLYSKSKIGGVVRQLNLAQVLHQQIGGTGEVFAGTAAKWMGVGGKVFEKHSDIILEYPC